ncbi:ribosomal protein L7/L12 [Brucella pseudogrignonensis]|uniref:ribosomal protein L7/L12 n=1 Tax=Brucella pseudogrignonensis TaxID=419475 RepID=UPI001ED9EC48|nr:ribosomal protein L7/L12 [Brucella pseudogrignonensis]UKK94956.1 ribosomal protein L7/L12 [Brucella pseudogrignonensis]
MGNVKVGDKVRSLVTQIDVRAGGLYEVKTVDGGDVWVIDDVGDNWYLASDEFEILPVAAKAPEDKPAFKVGDRVRVIKTDLFRQGTRVGDIGFVTSSRGNLVSFDLHHEASGVIDQLAIDPWKSIELAPLKIEAGKYYRTRDGRKVGPMEAWCFGGWHSDRAEHPLNGGVWLDDGTAKYAGAKDSPDLIAEWIDEPVKAAAPVAKPAIVALIENGQPKPSVAPFVHANETLAAKEAARLASLQKGKEFGVYVLTQKASEPAPSYKHEWQRFAAKGERVSAIKELRSVTGLGLKAAKDAVEHWIAHDEPSSRIAA